MAQFPAAASNRVRASTSRRRAAIDVGIGLTLGVCLGLGARSLARETADLASIEAVGERSLAGDPAVPSEPTASTPLRLLALGDSYTIGEGVPVADRWPVQLVRRLGVEPMAIACASPVVVARTGWRTDQLAAGVATRLAASLSTAERLAPPYDLVTLMAGVNDQFQRHGVARFARRFEALAATAVELAGNRRERVVVVSIPDWTASPYGAVEVVPGAHARLAREIDAFNDAACTVAEREGLAWVDVTALSRELGPDRSMFAADGLHPSSAQYARWVDSIAQVVRTIVTEPSVGRALAR